MSKERVFVDETRDRNHANWKSGIQIAYISWRRLSEQRLQELAKGFPTVVVVGARRELGGFCD